MRGSKTFALRLIHPPFPSFHIRIFRLLTTSHTTSTIPGIYILSLSNDVGIKRYFAPYHAEDFLFPDHALYSPSKQVFPFACRKSISNKKHRLLFQNTSHSLCPLHKRLQMAALQTLAEPRILPSHSLHITYFQWKNVCHS